MKLGTAFRDYDRTCALTDGRVRIEGLDARIHSTLIVPGIFERMIRPRACDVSDLGMTCFLRAGALRP